MKTIMRPQREVDVLSVAKAGASTTKILKEMVTKAQACVDHLCGCK